MASPPSALRAEEAITTGEAKCTEASGTYTAGSVVKLLLLNESGECTECVGTAWVPSQDHGEPSELAKSADCSNVAMEQLEHGDIFRCAALVQWLCPATLELAFSEHGCRVVQKALEVAGGADRAAIVDQLRGSVVNLVASPHGNYVLQKCIEVMPPGSVQFVMDELAKYPGGWIAFSRHRYGCRVAERLLEHCPEEIACPLIVAVIADAHTLCRHPFANYVVQHVIEFCSLARCNQIASVLLWGDVAMLAQHKHAHHVIEQALERCSPDKQQAMAHAILSQPPSLIKIACNRFGVGTAKKLAEVLRTPLREELLWQVNSGMGELRASKQGRSFMERLKGFM